MTRNTTPPMSKQKDPTRPTRHGPATDPWSRSLDAAICERLAPVARVAPEVGRRLVTGTVRLQTHLGLVSAEVPERADALVLAWVETPALAWQRETVALGVRRGIGTEGRRHLATLNRKLDRSRRRLRRAASALTRVTGRSVNAAMVAAENAALP